MAGNVLQFALGLSTGGFLSGMGHSVSAITGLIGSMLSLGAITHGVMTAIERGAELEHLHKRTGETVQGLYQLQRGFKAVGLSGDDVGNTLFMMQKAIGGVNEMGESTADIFKRMGLSVGELKKHGGAQQLDLIVQALAKLDQEGAAKAGSSIFGRMNAANMVQLSRSTDEFHDALEKAAGTGMQFQRNAALFKDIELTIARIKAKGMGLFIGIAEGAAPAINNVLQLLNHIDLSGIGKEVGRFLTAFTQAFRDGSVTNLIATALKAGFDAALAGLHIGLAKIGPSVVKGFRDIPFGIGSALVMASNLKSGNLVGLWDAMQANTAHTRENELSDPIIDAVMQADMARRMEELKKAFKPLDDLITSLVNQAPKNKTKEGEAGTTGLDFPNKAPKANVSDIEKMGFVFFNGSGAPDSNKTTAQNTTKMVSQLSRIHETLGRLGAPNYSNIS